MCNRQDCNILLFYANISKNILNSDFEINKGEYVMAKECSFDIVSEYNKQELVNAIDQVKRELTTRFDLKDSNLSLIHI